MAASRGEEKIRMSMYQRINGGRVYFGVSTSKSSKRYMVDVIEAIYWFGTDRGVKFSEASNRRIAWAQEWRASRG